MAQVDTAKVTEFRKLRFDTIDALIAEVDRIVASERAGKLRRTGNWTVGQTFGHLAAWINFGWDGYPMRVPWFIRLILKMKVKKMLRDGMPRGVRIPNTPEGTLATEKLTTDEGAARLKKALGRLQAGEIAKFDSPAFGPLSHEDRMRLNFRHAELHLGFLHP